MIHRIKIDGWVRGEHLSINGPFFLDIKALDIPNTLRGLINVLPDNCVGISIRWAGFKALNYVTKAARKKHIYVLWI